MKLRLQLLIILNLLIFHSCYAQPQDSIIHQSWLNLKEMLLRKANHVKELSDLLSKSSKITKTIPEDARNFAQLFSNTINAVKNINVSSIETINIQHQQLNSILKKLLKKSLKNSKSKNWNDPAIEIHGQLEGCENRIRYASNQYNDICHKYGLSGMFFGSYETE